MSYPQWICADCGRRYGNSEPRPFMTWHVGKCEVCLVANKDVTEPRDFGHLKDGALVELAKRKDVPT